jgi:hypothetical protein
MKSKLQKISFLLVIVFFIQSSTLAQVANISLKNQKIRLPENNFIVTKIFDARTDKKYIGLVYDYKNQPGIKKMVGFNEPLNMELNSLFETQNSININGTPLFITVNKLEVSDNNGVNELHRLLEINLDFYIKENEVYYHEFTAGNYVTSTQNPATQKIDKMIADAISNCYNEFLYRMNNKTGYHKEVTFEELKQNTLQEQVQNESFKFKGENRIFYTFNMFRDNLADTETQFLLKNKNEYHNDLAVLRYHPGNTETAEASTIWGVVYDNNLYLQIDGIFIKTRPTKNGYILDNMINFKNKSKAKNGFNTGFSIGLVPGFLMGGWIGAPIIGLASGGIGAAIGAAFRNIEMSSESHKIDMVTGLPKPILIEDGMEIKNMKQLVFYSSKFNSRSPDLIINEKTIGQFQQKSYYIHTLSDTLINLTVCLKTLVDIYCQSIATDFEGKRYFEVIVKSNGKLSILEKKQSQAIKYVEDEIKMRKLWSLN